MTDAKYHLNVAQTILNQLGGNRFAAMTGARQFVALDNPGLQFDLPARFAREDINRIRVVLDPSDTYTVTAFKFCRWSFRCEQKGALSGVYCDMLEGVFTELTGLNTRL
ncbi:hypothetical protein NF212_25360 (plasmid) [Parasalinivibrio latis]|uniref:hypothetical protein n=1 Tax=Parasalinivibrio latis TaxID=2952610 RepID=UPI0030E5DC19